MGKNKMVVFGGYNNPFQNVLIYNFDTKTWKCLNVKSMPKYLRQYEEIKQHSTIIIGDILYAFGGEVDDIESNLFCSLNLKTKKWQIITKHNPKNVVKNMEIPGSRSDHFMWK